MRITQFFPKKQPQANKDSILSGVMAVSDCVVVEQSEDDYFRPVSSLTGWARELFRIDVATQTEFQIDDELSFLGNFLIDARIFWLRDEAGEILAAGLWEEVLNSGERSEFEAEAIALDKRKILMVRKVGGIVSTDRDLIQRGREKLLSFEELDRNDRDLKEKLSEIEERFRRMAENAPDLIFRYCIKPSPYFEYVSPAAIRISGYKPDDFYADPFLAQKIVHPEDLNAFVNHHQNIDDMNNPLTLRWVHRDGYTVWTEERDVPIYNDAGELVALEGIVRDITDRKKTEEEHQRLERLESIGVLAGGIAHDFNNILTAILGNINVAKINASPESVVHKLLDDAEKASLSAKTLTQQLLTFAKGGILNKEITSISELLLDTASFVLSGSSVKCQFSIPDSLWCAEVDSGQFSQVINNIVINAKQSMPEGGIVEISAENITFTSKQCQDKSLPIKAGKYIRISIKDHGLGIPARHLDKIFDPFFTTKQTGSGLGLATSFSIMRNHGGYISVESEVGTGSTFIIFVRASTKAAPKYKEVTSIQPVIGGKILVMDDNAMVREIAGRMLNHIGCQEIEFAADGAEAITLFKKAQTSGKPFSAVILDLTIPGAIGGIETVKELLKLNPDTKAIVSSGYAGQPVMEEYKHYGFSGAVAKPYTIDQLHNALSGL